jgi:hypothetical protein
MNSFTLTSPVLGLRLSMLGGAEPTDTFLWKARAGVPHAPRNSGAMVYAKSSHLQQKDRNSFDNAATDTYSNCIVQLEPVCRRLTDLG